MSPAKGIGSQRPVLVGDRHHVLRSLLLVEARIDLGFETRSRSHPRQGARAERRCGGSLVPRALVLAEDFRYLLRRGCLDVDVSLWEGDLDVVLAESLVDRVVQLAS